MAQPQSCFDCGKSAPDTETSYTLISPMHGWRVTRERDPEGNYIARWRCADCWKKYKDSRTGGGEPDGPVSKKR